MRSRWTTIPCSTAACLSSRKARVGANLDRQNPHRLHIGSTVCDVDTDEPAYIAADSIKKGWEAGYAMLDCLILPEIKFLAQAWRCPSTQALNTSDLAIPLASTYHRRCTECADDLASRHMLNINHPPCIYAFVHVSSRSELFQYLNEKACFESALYSFRCSFPFPAR